MHSSNQILFSSLTQRELGVPMTLGVIANSVGADSELVTRIQTGASDTNNRVSVIDNDN